MYYQCLTIANALLAGICIPLSVKNFIEKDKTWGMLFTLNFVANILSAISNTMKWG